MGFTEKEKESMKKARGNIFAELERNCPDLYNEWKEEAKSGIRLSENRTGNYSEDEMQGIIIKEKIKETVRNNLRFVKSVMGMGLDAYSEQEISDLLEILFYFNNENTVSLYRGKQGLGKTDWKSINAQIKKGKFLYKYEEIYDSLMEVAERYGKKKATKHLGEDSEKKDCARFYQYVLQPVQTRIRRSREEELYFFIPCLIKKWNLCIDVAKTEIERIDQKNTDLFYAYHYFSIVSESISEVLYQLYQKSYNAKKRKWNMQPFFDSVLEDISSYHYTEKDNYNLVQNYGIYLHLNIFMQEKDIFIKIKNTLHKELMSGKYEKYNEKYDVRGLNLDLLSNQEIREKFCEGNNERIDRFEKKYGECKKLFKWFTEYRGRCFFCERSVALKAIYRECFVYVDMPEEINRRGMKSFFKSLENEELNEALNMSETEMYVWEKIRRGICRETNRLEEFTMRMEFLREFHKFEKKVVNHENRRNHYFSMWIDVLHQNIQLLLFRTGY